MNIIDSGKVDALEEELQITQNALQAERKIADNKYKELYLKYQKLAKAYNKLVKERDSLKSDLTNLEKIHEYYVRKVKA